MANIYEGTMLGAERAKATGVVWHMLGEDAEGTWAAMCCAPEAADSENYAHTLTNREHRVTCQACRDAMKAYEKKQKKP